MVDTAERARAKAEARRQRILAKAYQRLDVVSGLAPVDTVQSDADAGADGNGNDNAGEVVACPYEDKGGEDVVSQSHVESVAADGEKDSSSLSPTAVAASGGGGGGSAGARRMAAMRRRRYQQNLANKAKEEEEEEATAAGSAECGTGTVAVPSNNDKEAKEGATAASAADERDEKNEVAGGEDDSKTEKENEEAIATADTTNATANHDNPTGETATKKEESSEPVMNLANTTDNETITAAEQNDDDDESSTKKPKKYMGVARMRRKILKEQKAQRLKQLQDDSIASADMCGVDAAAELVTMGVTASIIRQGSMNVDGDGMNSMGGADGAVDLSRIAEQSLTIKKGRWSQRWWWRMFVPPLHLVPRLVTLGLLLMAGLDMGWNVHQRNGVGGMRNLGSDKNGGGSNSSIGHDTPWIGHVEKSLTKPWEYGMGGKIAYMAEKIPSAPPTALPTSFEEGYCAFGDNHEVCQDIHRHEEGEQESTNRRGSKSKLHKKVFSMEDEFDSSRGSTISTVDSTISASTNGGSGNAKTRPHGVVVSHDNSEFDDDILSTITTDDEPIIDPLFHVDFDQLIRNAQLPFPLDAAARLAIGFHRTWVYYLWTLPLSTIHSVIRFPKRFVWGWIRDPPIVFLICMAVRFINWVLVGSGSFDVRGKVDASAGGGGNGAGKLEKGPKNLDMLAKLTDYAKNYLGEKFPRTKLVVGTLMGVMKVDMYVVFFGMLVGSVVPLVVEEHGGVGLWVYDLKARLGLEGKVLGDGEL